VEGRGCGRTDNPGGAEAYTYATLAADAAALIEQLGLAPAHVAGYSEGGLVGLELAVTHSPAVRSVVGIGAHPTNDAKTRAVWERLDPEHIEQRVPGQAANLARRHDPHHAPGYWRELLRWVVDANAAAPAYAVEDLRRIRVPTLWIAGDDDAMFELDQLLTLKRHVPGAELLLVNHAGHEPQFTHPHLVGPAILDFLTRTDERLRP
jgi:pimeloyl-ACP methyl ester carboxylesterase